MLVKLCNVELLECSLITRFVDEDFSLLGYNFDEPQFFKAGILAFDDNMLC